MSTTTITFEWKVNDVLTNPTSVKLSDPTATFGVKRTDTSAVVVADDTAMTNQSTGVYTYSFTDPAADLTYNYYIEVVYNGLTHHFEKNLSGPGSGSGESTLAVQFTDLQELVGYKLGFRRDTGTHSTDETALITDVIKRGLRKFYAAHNWSFMYPITNLTFVADQWEYSAPDDFGGLKGKMTYQSDSLGTVSITETSSQKIRQLREQFDNFGDEPRFVAIVPTAGDGTSGQRHQFQFYPIPDSAVVVDYQYWIRPDALTSGAPYPRGGMEHAETVLAACLAAAELHMNDEQGPEHANFMEQLGISIKLDQSNSTPDYIGRMQAEGEMDGSFGPYRWYDNTVLYNGAAYPGS